MAGDVDKIRDLERLKSIRESFFLEVCSWVIKSDSTPHEEAVIIVGISGPDGVVTNLFNRLTNLK